MTSTWWQCVNGRLLTVAASEKHSLTCHLTKDTNATRVHTGCHSGGSFRQRVVCFSLIASNELGSCQRAAQSLLARS